MTTAAPFWTIDATQVQFLMLAVARLSGMLFLTPPFGGGTVPVQVRMPLALALALPLWGSLAAAMPPLAPNVLTLAALGARELVVGLVIGFVGRLVMAAAAFAAEIIGVQIGFGIAATIDPALGSQVTVLTRLYDWTMLGLFLALDAHHLFVGAVIESFRAVPVGGTSWGADGAAALVSMGGRIFSLGFALVAPTLGVLFVANIVLVLASRSVPQLHLMVVGWPITVLVGLVVLIGNVDLMGGIVGREMEAVERVLIGVLRSFGDGR